MICEVILTAFYQENLLSLFTISDLHPNKKMKSLLVLTVLGFSLGMFSCSQAGAPDERVGTENPQKETRKKTFVPPASETGTSGEIYITVDESLLPIIEAEIEQFQGLYPNASVHPLYMPGEEAIRTMLTGDSIRLAIATRKLTEEEEEILESKTIAPRHSQIFTEGVTLISHKENNVKDLTRDDLRKILLGDHKSWTDISGSNLKNEIRIVFDHAASGTIRFLKDSVLIGQNIRQDNVYALKSSPSVLEYVAENTNSIGVIGVSWISDVDDEKMRDFLSKVNVLRIEKPDSGVPCAYEEQFFGPWQSFLNQGCYPLRRPVFTILRETSFGLGTGLVSFLDGPVGQRIVHKAGLSAFHGIPRRVKLPPKEGARNPLKSKK